MHEKTKQTSPKYLCVIYLHLLFFENTKLCMFTHEITSSTVLCVR